MLPRVIRRVLPTVLVAVALVASGCGSVGREATPKPAQTPKGPPPPTRTFHSRPGLKPPPVQIRTAAHSTAPGYIFLGVKMKVLQAGPMIIDNRGQLVWFNPLDTHGVADVKVQRYRGKPVITWWRGRAPMGVGTGYFAIYDNRYKLVARVRAGHGYAGDIHEFLITPRNTALFTIYHRIPVDLTSIGGPKEGRIFDGIVQEVAIPSGKVLFEWHSWPAIGLDESYAPPPDKDKGAKAAPDDYVHLNSIDVERNGNLLVSARNTRAVYEISRRTKKVLWRLGGKKSDFTMGAGTTFAWQHDARRQPDGTITIFDNGAAPPVEKLSRVLVLELDQAKKTATLVRSYSHPKELLVPFEGNAQFLPNGHVFVGWGAVPYFTEFARNGRVLLDGSFGKGTAKITGPNQDADTYRAFRFVWHGSPTDRPAAAVSRGKLYVSWNGATEVAKWQLLSGRDDGSLTPGQTVRKGGFETAISLRGVKGPAYAARALDRTGRILGTSRVVQASGG
jgi:Arylsulfotransferase (ASST)